MLLSLLCNPVLLRLVNQEKKGLPWWVWLLILLLLIFLFWYFFYRKPEKISSEKQSAVETELREAEIPEPEALVEEIEAVEIPEPEALVEEIEAVEVPEPDVLVEEIEAVEIPEPDVLVEEVEALEIPEPEVPLQEVKAVQMPDLVQAEPEDLTLIEGIGPKINLVLHTAGVKNFAELAIMDAEGIKKILTEAGLRLADTSTWPAQAKLAAEGKLEELKTLQDSLKGGRAA